MWEFPECVKININDLGVSVRKVRMDYVRILMHLYLGNSCLLLTGGSICLLWDAPTHPEAQPRGGKVDPDSTQSVDEERNYALPLPHFSYPTSPGTHLSYSPTRAPPLVLYPCPGGVTHASSLRTPVKTH
ncbi:hypothetical protein Pcinc_031228 [Petrolisthes cinctipes]|uniref:Uncharacterized protein n=1 Tax=Petrolisthes cinctipes TaxID=88211 RepID=A0AAE1EWR6_PETCI|nr:hypothetical protein Pcinc_031228 [Petrolisthes cinctipes]